MPRKRRKGRKTKSDDIVYERVPRRGCDLKDNVDIEMVQNGTLGIRQGSTMKLSARLNNQSVDQISLHWQKMDDKNIGKDLCIQSDKYSGSSCDQTTPELTINDIDIADAGIYRLEIRTLTEIVQGPQVVIEVFGGLTNVENNFIRFFLLCQKIGTKSVRQYFDRKVPPAMLSGHLNAHSYLKSNKIIRFDQLKTLYPAPPIVCKSADLDFTLLYSLIRNTLTDPNNPTPLGLTIPPPTQNWGKEPLIGDLTEEDDIERIRSYRNTLAHNTDFQLQDGEFSRVWLDLSQVIDRLGLGSLKEDVSELKIKSFNYTYKAEVQKCIMEDIKELRDEMEEIKRELSEQYIPKTVRDLIEKDILEWKKDQEKFVVTRATDVVKTLLKTTNCIVVTGSSGSGKSSIIHHVALELHQNESYEIVTCVTGPGDIIRYYNSKRNQIFVVDDICGKETINTQTVNLWRDHTEKLEKIFGHKLKTGDDTDAKIISTKILVSSRLHIFKDHQFKRLNLFKEECNILSPDVCLLTEERLSMIKQYISDDKIRIINQNFIDKFDFFPLLCKLSEGKDKNKVYQIFSEPTETIKNDIEELRLNSSVHFCSLCLCILFDNSFDIEWLNPRLGKQGILKQFKLDLDVETDRKSIKAGLSSLVGTFLKEQNGVYGMIHDKIYDIAAVIAGEHLTELYIEYASGTFIGDRFLFESIKSKPTCFILVEKDLEELYFDRTVQDLNKNDIYSSLHNKQLKYDIYRQKLLKYWGKNRDKIQKVFVGMLVKFDRQKDEVHMSPRISTPLIEAITERYTDIVKFLIDLGCDVNTMDDMNKSPLYIASERKYIAVVKLLLEKNADISQCDKNGRSPLYIACVGGHTDIVKLLLDKNADMSQCGDYGTSPLNIACQRGYTDIVKLLLKKNADISQCDECSQSPFFVACQGGHKDIVKLLLENNADIFYSRKDGQSPLYKACEGGYTDIVKLLIEKNANITQCERNGQSPFFKACEEGHTDILKLLLENNADISRCANDGKSPLYIACKRGHLNIVKLLLENKADISQCDGMSQSPLFIACKCGNYDTVRLLLEYKADITQCDEEGRSPLFIACSSREALTLCGFFYYSKIYPFTETVKLLLEYKADINQCNNKGQTPVHACCQAGNLKIFQLLLEKDADITILDNNGHSPIDLAKNMGFDSILEMLKGIANENVV